MERKRGEDRKKRWKGQSVSKYRHKKEGGGLDGDGLVETEVSPGVD